MFSWGLANVLEEQVETCDASGGLGPGLECLSSAMFLLGKTSHKPPQRQRLEQQTLTLDGRSCKLQLEMNLGTGRCDSWGHCCRQLATPVFSKKAGLLYRFRAHPHFSTFQLSLMSCPSWCNKGYPVISCGAACLLAAGIHK